MNTELYEQWIRSHRMESEAFDCTDSVMNQIVRGSRRPGLFQGAWVLFLLDIIQTKSWLRAGVLTAGALASLLRMAFIVYCGLFA
jgi:hypothetical protein